MQSEKDDSEMKIDTNQRKELKENEHDEDPSEAKEDQEASDNKEDDLPEDKLTNQHIMFETDNAEACFAQAIWFGQRIPGKRRAFGRGANKASEGSEFPVSPVTLQECKNILVRIQSQYSESSRNHDREWSDKAERESWVKSVNLARNCKELSQLMKQLDEGMCLPFFLS